MRALRLLGAWRPRVALAWVLLLLFTAPAGAQMPKPGAAPATISVAQRRAQLRGAADKLSALEARSGGGKRSAVPILKALDIKQLVRRADGATQSTQGNRWSALAAGVPWSGNDLKFDVTALQKKDVARLRREVELEIDALDAWDARPYYKSVDAGAIVAQLEKSGQIRTGPTWWQSQVGGFWKRVSDAFSSFWNWLSHLFPKSAPRASAAPNMSWLVFVFWAIIIGLLGLLIVLAYRAFAGNIRWGRRARASNEDELEGQDRELLLLPPDELGARAAQFAREGNFREAVRHRFIALLLRLDGSGFWHYDARRTNWEHIAALRQQAQNQSVLTPLADLTRRFDRVRYGGAACDAENWQQFERDALALEAQTGARELAGGAR